MRRHRISPLRLNSFDPIEPPALATLRILFPRVRRLWGWVWNSAVRTRVKRGSPNRHGVALNAFLIPVYEPVRRALDVCKACGQTDTCD